MLVLKFGGTSVGKPERMRKIADQLLATPGKKIVVLSALSGTTNTLVRIGENLLNKKPSEASQEINALEKHYLNFIQELFGGEAYKAIGQEIVSRYFITTCRSVKFLPGCCPHFTSCPSMKIKNRNWKKSAND
jgi:aspartate kinase